MIPLRLALIVSATLVTACSPDNGAPAPERPAARSQPAPATVVIGAVDAPEALAAFLRTFASGPGKPLTAVAARTVDGGPAHPRITLAYLADSEWCGSGGCTLLVLEQKGEGLFELSRTTISHAPIRVLRSRSNGMPDLSVRVRGDYYPGDGPKFVALPFDGRAYALNPTMPPARLLRGAVEGEIAISEADAAMAFRH